MDSKHIHQVIYREGLGDLLKDRVRESMCLQKRTCQNLGSQLCEEMGLRELTVAHFVANLRRFPSFELPIYSNYISVSPKESLRRVSLVLHALNFDANEEVILRLRRLYGNDFVYPPLKIEELQQPQVQMKQWTDYL
jgi:hypothetical protein